MATKTLAKEDYIKGFKIIFSYVRQFTYDANVLAIVSLLNSVGDAVVPLIMGKFFDALIHGNSVWLLLVIWSITQIVTVVSGSYTNFKTSVVGDKIFGRYLEEATYHLLDLPLAFHKKKKMSVITNTIQKSANDIATVFNKVITNISSDILTLIVSFFIAYFISPLLTLVSLAGVVLYCFTILKILGPGAELQRKNRKKWQESWRTTYEGVDNIATVKSMVSDTYEKSRTSKKLWDALGHQVNLYWLYLKMGVTQRVITTVTRLAVFLVSIVLLGKHSITIGQVISFNTYVGLFFTPFINFGNYWQSFQNAFISINEADETLNVSKENYRPENAVILKHISGNITFKNVEFYYEKKNPVLKDISVDIKAGEVIALVGKSGEGKSTFIDLISGHYFPQKGKVTIDGVPTNKIDLKFLRTHIAIVPQEVVLFNDTIETNIKYGSFKASKAALERAALQAHAMEFIEKMPKKWNQIVGERGYKLSVGQKQRVAIARAILKDPRILILDEPTSALDAESESIIQKSLTELMQNRTTFIIAHRLSTVRRADKILVFKEGQIVEVGKHEELITREGGVYRNLYELQVGLHE